MWTVGVTRTGNECGLTEEEWNAASATEQAEMLARARTRLQDAGAHYLTESVGECMDIVDEIAGRIAAGERP
jgi:phosphonoacetaldehyde hydrolase